MAHSAGMLGGGGVGRWQVTGHQENPTYHRSSLSLIKNSMQYLLTEAMLGLFSIDSGFPV